MIRNIYLRETNNPFYLELDEVKNLYYRNLPISKPSSAKDIETFDEDGNETGTLADLQQRLYQMLIDIAEVWEQEGIHYTLDGGSLLGAIRERGHFIFGDDDIDVAIPYEEQYLRSHRALPVGYRRRTSTSVLYLRSY